MTGPTVRLIPGISQPRQGLATTIVLTAGTSRTIGRVCRLVCLSRHWRTWLPRAADPAGPCASSRSGQEAPRGRVRSQPLGPAGQAGEM